MAHDVPDIANAYFDFATRTFRDGEGLALSDEALNEWGNALRRDRAASARRSSLKSGLLLKSLSHAEGSELVTVLCRSPISLRHLGFEGERANAAQI